MSQAQLFSGVDGYFKAGPAGQSDVVGEMNHFTVTISHAVNETTTFASNGWASFKKGVVSWTASGDGFWNCQDKAQGYLHTAIAAATAGATEVEAYFHTDDAYYLYGIGLVTTETLDDAVAGVATVTFDLQGTGVLYSLCPAA